MTPYSIPWQVGLVSPGSDSTWCGGTIIGPNHILTAAHCMGYSFEVIVGEHNLTNTDDGTRHTVCQAISHPQYTSSPTTDYDYAVVVLNEAIELGGRAVPACLPGADFAGSFLDDKTMTVSGWGRLESGGDSPNVLHSVDVPGISNEECAASYSNEQISDAMLCAGQPEGGIDSCQGDSGG